MAHLLRDHSGSQSGEGFRGQWQDRKERAREEQEGMKRRLISSVLLLIPLMYVAMGEHDVPARCPAF